MVEFTMPKTDERNGKLKFDIKVPSKVFSGLSHIVQIDLYCYEKMPTEKQMMNGSNVKNERNKNEKKLRENSVCQSMHTSRTKYKTH